MSNGGIALRSYTLRSKRDEDRPGKQIKGADRNEEENKDNVLS